MGTERLLTRRTWWLVAGHVLALVWVLGLFHPQIRASWQTPIAFMGGYWWAGTRELWLVLLGALSCWSLAALSWFQWSRQPDRRRRGGPAVIVTIATTVATGFLALCMVLLSLLVALFDWPEVETVGPRSPSGCQVVIRVSRGFDVETGRIFVHFPGEMRLCDTGIAFDAGEHGPTISSAYWDVVWIDGRAIVKLDEDKDQYPKPLVPGDIRCPQ